MNIDNFIATLLIMGFLIDKDAGKEGTKISYYEHKSLNIKIRWYVDTIDFIHLTASTKEDTGASVTIKPTFNEIIKVVELEMGKPKNELHSI